LRLCSQANDSLETSVFYSFIVSGLIEGKAETMTGKVLAACINKRLSDAIVEENKWCCIAP